MPQRTSEIPIEPRAHSSTSSKTTMMLPRSHLIPTESYRHAAPSAPWPWVDIDDRVDPSQLQTQQPPVPVHCDHSNCNGNCWKNYPKSCFPNWTDTQVRKSKIREATDNPKDCVIYVVDVDDKGVFGSVNSLQVFNNKQELAWERFMEARPRHGLRVRALFVENLSGPILQMLGAKYNIEPFFFSSSLNWIPSRYQESIKPGDGDHITITMPFLRSLSEGSSLQSSTTLSDYTAADTDDYNIGFPGEHTINTRAPLDISIPTQERQLILDLLSVHLIRRRHSSTIISYHPHRDLYSDATKASYLQERVCLAGRSVYWQNIFQHSPDPTFVLLIFLWHALYAWDEALEHLYAHICSFEREITRTTNATQNTRRLHEIRAHLLQYGSLLKDFEKTIEFIRVTRNPALDSSEISDSQRALSQDHMEWECANLLQQITRLNLERSMQDERLKNIMDLVFSSVNIIESRYMKEMTEAAVRDSAAMRQISYLSMLFLPASFIATVFGMNVNELSPGTNGTLPHYFLAAIPMTVVTIWIIVAFQIENIYEDPVTIWGRMAWPVLLMMKILRRPFKTSTSPKDSQFPNKERPVNIIPDGR